MEKLSILILSLFVMSCAFGKVGSSSGNTPENFEGLVSKRKAEDKMKAKQPKVEISPNHQVGDKDFAAVKEELKAKIKDKESGIKKLKALKVPDDQLESKEATIKLHEEQLKDLKERLAQAAYKNNRDPASVGSGGASAEDEAVTAKGPGVCAHCEENAPNIGLNEQSNPSQVRSQVGEAQGTTPDPSKKTPAASGSGGDPATGAK